MKYLIIGLSLVSLRCVAAPKPLKSTPAPAKAPKPAPKREVADKVLATIYHPEDKVVICQSDLQAGLGGQAPSLRDAIIKELIILDGKALTKSKILNINISEDEVEKALSRAQEQLGKTREELIEFFKEQGLTLAEAKKELERGLIIETVIEARVKTKSMISDRAIELYHKEHPHVTYSLRRAEVPLNGSSKALTRAIIDREIASGDIETSVSWVDIRDILEKDFAPEKAYLKELPAGAVVISDESDEGFVLLKFVEKKEASLADRKNEISSILSQELYITNQKNYFDKLMNEANIRYSGLPEVAAPS